MTNHIYFVLLHSAPIILQSLLKRTPWNQFNNYDECIEIPQWQLLNELFVNYSKLKCLQMAINSVWESEIVQN